MLQLPNPVKGLFIFWQHQAHEQAGEKLRNPKELAAICQDLGANAVVLPAHHTTKQTVEALHKAGIFVAASQNTISLAEGETPKKLGLEKPYLAEQLNGKPIDGSPLCPTNPSLLAIRRQQAEALIDETNLDGFWLDSVRFPAGRWEADRATRPLDVCYCQRCRDIKAALPAKYRKQWRTHAITAALDSLIPRQKRESGVTLGYWQVPFTRRNQQDWEDRYGQTARPQLPDGYLTSPMAYHRMMLQPPTFVGDVLATVGRFTKKQQVDPLILPGIQAEDRPDELPASELSLAITSAFQLSRGPIVFFAEALFGPDGKTNDKYRAVQAAFQSQ